MQGEIEGMQDYSLRNFKNFYQKEGLQGLYRGYSISIFCIPVFNTIYFPTYEFIKEKLRTEYGYQNDSVSLYVLGAGIAGTICNVLTNPLWLMRTRM